MNDAVEYLDIEDLIGLAVALLGDPSRPRHRPSGGGCPPSSGMPLRRGCLPDRWTKAAALRQSVVENHPLVDGNKRLGWLATATFLELNGVEVTKATNDDVYELMMRVAASRPSVDDLAECLRTLLPS